MDGRGSRMGGGVPPRRPPVVVVGVDEGHGVPPGWSLRSLPLPDAPWDLGGRRWFAHLEVATTADVETALDAVVRGVGVSVRVSLPGLDRVRFLDDLARAGDLAGPGGTDHPPAPGLTPEERRLLQLLADGSTVADAAHTLGWSRRTLQRRLDAIRSRLGVTTTTEAIRTSGVTSSR